MYDGPPPKIALYLFSPENEKHSEPPFFKQTASSKRKYQQRGRWQRLPPTVPRLRICGVPTECAASARPGKFCRTIAFSSSCVRVTRAPILKPVFALPSIRSRPRTVFRLTTRD